MHAERGLVVPEADDGAEGVPDHEDGPAAVGGEVGQAERQGLAVAEVAWKNIVTLKKKNRATDRDYFKFRSECR